MKVWADPHIREDCGLKIEDLHPSFGGIKALQGVNFEAREGEIKGVIGPNGAGKTSLFNAISGFYTPDKGRVSFFRGMTVLDNIK